MPFRENSALKHGKGVLAQGGCETLLYVAQELQFDFTKATTVLQSHQGGLGLWRHEARHDPGLIPLPALGNQGTNSR